MDSTELSEDVKVLSNNTMKVKTEAEDAALDCPPVFQLTGEASSSGQLRGRRWLAGGTWRTAHPTAAREHSPAGAWAQRGQARRSPTKTQFDCCFFVWHLTQAPGNKESTLWNLLCTNELLMANPRNSHSHSRQQATEAGLQ